MRDVCRLDERFSGEVGSYEREQFRVEAIDVGLCGIEPSS